MDILKIIVEARNILSKWSTVEIPACSQIIPEGWMHPDIFSRFFGDDEGNLFTIQPAFESPCSQGKGEKAGYFLIWFKKPFSNTWISRIAEFVGSLFSLNETAVQSCFEMMGRNSRQTILSENGCAWDTLWKGCRIGEIRFFSGILGEKLSTCSGAAIFDLEVISNIILGNVNFDTSFWAPGIQTKDLAVLKYRSFYDGSVDESPLRSAQAQWERIRESVENGIARKRWHEAFGSGLEGISLVSEISLQGAQMDAFRQTCEIACRGFFKKLFPILPKTAIVPGQAGKPPKEGVLR